MTISSNIIHTYYDILGVKEDASYEQIRATYRTLILSSHPDKLLKDSETSTADDDTSNRFIELQQAWEILSNPESRSTYDNELQILRLDAATSEDVNLEDLTIEDGGETLECSYRCRCGDYFAIDSSELAEMGYFLSRNGSVCFSNHSKYMESKLKRKSSLAGDSFCWAFSPTRDLYGKEMQEKRNEDEAIEENFLTPRSLLSCSTSASSIEAFASAKTAFSRASSMCRIEFPEYQRRHLIIRELRHCEGWPFGLLVASASAQIAF